MREAHRKENEKLSRYIEKINRNKTITCAKPLGKLMSERRGHTRELRDVPRKTLNYARLRACLRMYLYMCECIAHAADFSLKN